MPSEVPECQKLMQTFQCREYSTDPAVAVVESEVPIEEPKKGEVQVRPLAWAIHAGDCKITTGILSKLMDCRPYTYGRDFAGVVTRVGPDTRDFTVGDRVFGMSEDFTKARGAASDYIVVQCKYLLSVPAGLSMEQAVTCITPSHTAHQALIASGLVKPDEPAKNNELKVLILGGTASTGNMVLQWCRAFGVGHIATTSSQVELCRRLGAHRVINHRAGEDWKELLKGGDFDAVINCVEGVESWYAAPSVLKKSGARYITLNIDDPHNPLTPFGVVKLLGGLAYRKPWSIFGYPSYQMVMVSSIDGQKQCAEFLRDGKIEVVLHDAARPTFPWTLDALREMYGVQVAGRAHGRLIMARDA